MQPHPQAWSIQNKLLAWLYTKPADQKLKLWIAGNGELLFSPVYRQFLREFDPVKLPNVRFHFQTNGTLLNERTWADLRHLHDCVDGINISVDSLDPDRCRRLRGGTLEQLTGALKLVSELRRAGRICYFGVTFTAQTENWREMGHIATELHSIGVDQFNIMPLVPVVYNGDDYNRRAVHLKGHPEHEAFAAACRSLPHPANIDGVFEFL